MGKVNPYFDGRSSSSTSPEVKNSILEIKGVTGVFDLHIWTITSGVNAVSGHVVVIDRSRSQTVLQDIIHYT
jgi:cobalt-zinc-cadmium efflux system protein